MRKFIKLVAIAVAAMSLSVMVAEAAGAGTNFVPTPPPTNTGSNPSIGVRGPGGTTPPSTGTPRPTYVAPGGGLVGPGAVDIGDLVCIAWDYVYNKCVGWRRQNRASSIQIWNAYGGGPILNYIWASPTDADFTELGYFYTDNNNNRYCHAYDYTYNICVGWNPKRPPWVGQYPVMNYIWVDPATLTYIREGYWSNWWPWY